MNRLFVYGTLKRGGENGWFLEGLPHEEGVAQGFILRSVYGLPAMMPGEGAVRGEVYDVNAALLRQLDAFEGHPSFYTRTLITLEGGEECWAYLREGEGEIVESGEWPLQEGRGSGG